MCFFLTLKPAVAFCTSFLAKFGRRRRRKIAEWQKMSFFGAGAWNSSFQMKNTIGHWSIQILDIHGCAFCWHWSLLWHSVPCFWPNLGTLKLSPPPPPKFCGKWGMECHSRLQCQQKNMSVDIQNKAWSMTSGDFHLKSHICWPCHEKAPKFGHVENLLLPNFVETEAWKQCHSRLQWQKNMSVDVQNQAWSITSGGFHLKSCICWPRHQKSSFFAASPICSSHAPGVQTPKVPIWTFFLFFEATIRSSMMELVFCQLFRTKTCKDFEQQQNLWFFAGFSSKQVLLTTFSTKISTSAHFSCFWGYHQIKHDEFTLKKRILNKISQSSWTEVELVHFLGSDTCWNWCKFDSFCWFTAWRDIFLQKPRPWVDQACPIRPCKKLKTLFLGAGRRLWILVT